MKISKKRQAEIDGARDELRKMLKPGDTVRTVLQHCSRSGMMRHIKLVICHDGEVLDISWLAARAMNMRLAENGGIKIGGCGMDMGFDLVYSLGRTLFPKGFKLATGQYGRNGDNSRFDDDGGYALYQRWL